MAKQKNDQQTDWKNRGERSNRLMVSLLVWIALNLGRPIIKLILYPVTFYFMLFAPSAKAASTSYLNRVFGKAPSQHQIWKHFYTFAQTSVDRFYFLANQTQQFNIRTRGLEIIQHYAEQKQGCLLLIAHFGSFDVLRVTGTREESLPIRILMDHQHNPTTMQLIDSLDPELAGRIIDASQSAPALVLAMDQHLKTGEMIGVMADRAGANEKTESVDFLGKPASFPQGPWQLAAALKVPVIMCVGVFEGGNNYSLHIELLTEKIDSSRKERAAVISYNMAHYARRLEHHLKQAPYNWFNFYNFWNDDAS
jgi:predicted LPLAT superfamily acyltransferase